MKIYINDFVNPVKTEILPTDTPTLDETLETFSFALLSNDEPLPLAPMQKVKVDFLEDGTDVAYFYIVSDSVETYSLNPLKYKHTISCIQNTRKLSKHIVRNSMFSQPANLKKSSFNALSMGAGEFDSGEDIEWANPYVPSLNWASEPLSLKKQEKIKNPRFKMSFQWMMENNDSSQNDVFTNAHGVSDILDNTSLDAALAAAASLTLRCTIPNGDPNDPNDKYTETITPTTFGLSAFNLNGSYDYPRIKILADQGYNDFEILFNSLDFITGTWIINDPQDPPPNYKCIAFYMVQVSIEAELYYYSAYDILDLLIKRQQKKTNLRTLDALFSLPTWTSGAKPEEDKLYTLLKETIAPNFCFTQATMYECVAEVFRLFDAIFTMDQNGKLGIEFFNDLSKEPIAINKFSGRTLALGEDKYTNGLMTEYQDARSEEIFPEVDGFAPLRSVEFGVPEAQDHHFIVPHPIDAILKCEIYLDPFNRNDGAISVSGGMAVDITRQVVEQTVWSSLENGIVHGAEFHQRKVKKANSVYYVKGDNKIEVAMSQKNTWQTDTHWNLYEATEMALCRMAGMEEGIGPSDILKGSWGEIFMRLTYVSSVDGKTEIHSLTNKYDGETMIDQSNGAVDLNKMGLNILGLALKLGNPTLNATHKITSWANRIKTGQLYEYEGGIWVANVVSYTFFGGFIQGKVSFVQNFNQLALRTKLLREKRMTNISQELVMKSEEIITDFVYFCTGGFLDITSDTIHFNNTHLKNFLLDSFNFTDITSKTHTFCFDSGQELLGQPYEFYLPTITYGAGNTINFEMGFEHPMNAGNQTSADFMLWGTRTSYFTQHVIYTDDVGFKEKVKIKALTNAVDFATEQGTSNFPVFLYSSAAGLFDIELDYYKQPNEIFALNYQLAFLPLPARENIDFIGNEFINTNCFVKDLTGGNRTKYVCFFETKSSNLDTKATDYFLKEKCSSVALRSQPLDLKRVAIRFSFPSLTTAERAKTKSWAIVDEQENILFASNTMPDASYVDIYFIPKLNRI